MTGRFIKQTGLDKAAAQIAALAQISNAFQGVYLPGSTRDDGKTNGEIIDWLAEGGRDITPSVADADLCAMEFKTKVEFELNKIPNVPGKKIKQAVSTAKGTQIAAKVWRATGVVMMSIMSGRVEDGLTNDDSAADKVTKKPYARSRYKKSGIPYDVVYKNTGQLLANVVQGYGALRLIKTN